MDLDTINARLAPLFPGLMGVQVTGASPERISARLTVRADLCTLGGILHGGAIMAFADTLGALGTLLNLPPSTRTVTIESKTNFIGGAPSGSTVSAECVPLHRGKTTMVWQTTITGASGKTVAVVSQTQLVIPV